MRGTAADPNVVLSAEHPVRPTVAPAHPAAESSATQPPATEPPATEPPATGACPEPNPADPSGLLREGLAHIGLELSDAAVERLMAYVGLLLKWNAVYNLTAIRDRTGMVVQHLLDSLAIVPVLQRQADLCHARIADVGSGAGLPGVPLAITLPHSNVTLIETVGKKSAFQQQVQAELALTNVMIYKGRAESLRQPHDVVICRAFSSLREFVAASGHLGGPNALWVAMKGQASDEPPPPGMRLETVTISVPFLRARRHLALLRRVTG